MIAKWDIGRKMLTSGELARMYRRCAPSNAPLCAVAQEKAKAAGGYDDHAYFFLLYELMEQKERFVWKGKSYESGDDSDLFAYTAMLRQKILSAYIKINDIPDNPQVMATRAAEEAAKQTDLSPLAIKRLHYRIAYLLSGQKKLLIGKDSFFSVEELSAHMQSLADKSFESFQLFSHQLIQDNRTLDPQFEIWLEATGHIQALEAWRQILMT